MFAKSLNIGKKVEPKREKGQTHLRIAKKTAGNTFKNYQISWK